MAIGEPNVMIKIPGHGAGYGAMYELMTVRYLVNGHTRILS